MEKFKVKDNDFVSKAILECMPMLSYSSIMKILRNKDVKINGKRTGENVKVVKGDEITVYPLPNMLETKKLNYSVVFEDENILVADKPVSVEVVRDEGADLTSSIIADGGYTYLKPMHRLDKNTRGLIVFAKNDKAYNELYDAFKNRTISKYYLALVRGIVPKKTDVLNAFLLKDANNSAIICDKPVRGAEAITTAYKVIKRREDSTLIEVELVTGKYHQIRAHMAHIGFPLVGETRYAREVKKEGKEQKLVSYKLVFHFTEGQYLHYLDGKVVQLNISL